MNKILLQWSINPQNFNKIPGSGCNKVCVPLVSHVLCFFSKIFQNFTKQTPTFHITYLYNKNNNSGTSTGNGGVLTFVENKYHKTYFSDRKTINTLQEK